MCLFGIKMTSGSLILRNAVNGETLKTKETLPLTRDVDVLKGVSLPVRGRGVVLSLEILTSAEDDDFSSNLTLVYCAFSGHLP